MITTQEEFYKYEWLRDILEEGGETDSRPEESTKFVPSSIERLYGTLKLLEGLRHGDVVMDLGSGKGVLMQALKRFAPDVTYVGVDHEQSNVDYLNSLDDPKVIGVCANLLDGIPRVPEIHKIDYITCIGVFGIGDVWCRSTAYGLLDIMWEKSYKGIIASFLREDKDDTFNDNTFDPLKVYVRLLRFSKRATIFQPHVPHFVVGAAYKFDTIWMDEWRAAGGRKK